MKKIVLILLVVATFGCKNEKKQNLKKSASSVEILDKIKLSDSPNFMLTLNAKVIEDDKFRLLYTEELGQKFSGEKIIFTDVKGSTKVQAIKFILSKKDIYPIRLRLDFPNRSLKGIVIESIEIEHEDNKLTITPSELNKYFYPNDYIDYNFEEGEVKFINKKGKDYPYFVSRKPLHDELIAF